MLASEVVYLCKHGSVLCLDGPSVPTLSILNRTSILQSSVYSDVKEQFQDADKASVRFACLTAVLANLKFTVIRNVY